MIWSAFTVGRLRTWNENSHSAGTTLLAMPPLTMPVWAVVKGTSKCGSYGPSARCLSARSRMKQIMRAAYSMALTPCGVSAEYAAWPWTRQRYRLMPLWATTGRMPVGSPTMEPSGNTPRACRSMIISGGPTQPTSSSNERARCKGLASRVACIVGSSDSAVPMNPFMSHAPRAYSLPSRRLALKGWELQAWPSTGTTSVWPDSTMPPVLLPSCAGSVANRLALAPDAWCVSTGSTPALRRWSRTVSISPRLELRLVVSNASSRSIQGMAAISAPAGARASVIWSFLWVFPLWLAGHGAACRRRGQRGGTRRGASGLCAVYGRRLRKKRAALGPDLRRPHSLVPPALPNTCGPASGAGALALQQRARRFAQAHGRRRTHCLPARAPRLRQLTRCAPVRRAKASKSKRQRPLPCIGHAKPVGQKICQRHRLLSDKAPVRQAALGEQVERSADAGGCGQFDGAQGMAGHLGAKDAGAVGVLRQPPAAQAAGRGAHHDHVLIGARDGAFQDVPEQFAPLAQAQVVEQQFQDGAVAGIADRLVVDLPGLAGQRFGECAQAAGGVESLVLDTVEHEILQPPQRRHRGAQAVDDGFAGVAVFVDEALGAPGQVVAQRALRVARQRSDAQAQAVQALETARQVVAHDADEARRQAALGHQHAAGPGGQRADGLGAWHVFGQVEIMHARLGAGAGERDGAMEWQRIEHGKAAVDDGRPVRVGGCLPRGDAQGGHLGQPHRVAVGHQDVVVARLLQQQGDGKADMARAQDADRAAQVAGAVTGVAGVAGDVGDVGHVSHGSAPGRSENQAMQALMLGRLAVDV